MRNLFYYFWTILLITVIAGYGQSRWAGEVLPGMETARSIHQIEWEKYRDYEPPAPPSTFQGRPMPLQLRKVPPSREIFGYLPYWVYPSYPNLNYGILTTIAYFGAEVDGFGNIVNQHHWPATDLINLAHSHGVRVVLTAILFDGNQIATMLGNPTYRSNLINNLLTRVQVANADGVTIDFEGVPGSQKQNLTTFMDELTTAFHNAIPGSYVSIFTPAVDWSNAFDYFSLAQITDGLIMQGYDYHWRTGPEAGPVAPLTSGSVWGYWNVTRTVDDYLFKTMNNSAKLILSVPFYGFEWPTVDDQLASATTGAATTLFYSTAYPNAQFYGYLWDQHSQTPWYKYNDGGQWHQGWFDDSLSLSLKFDLVNTTNLKGVAIWALSYDGQRQELQAALANAFGSTAPPLKPTNFRITNLGNYRVQLAVDPAAGATSYRVYKSTDAVTFTPLSDFPSATTTLSNLSPDSIYYFKVSALNNNGESNTTEVLAVRPAATGARILIVNGFDRTSGTVNTFDFIKRFAPHVVNAGYEFDACANEVIEDQQIALINYPVVIWILGEEGTADESFSNTEQARVADYLENGGQLFVSGSEIGYDLVQQGSPSDQQFYATYLKAQYVLDRVPTHSVSMESGGIFAGLGDMNFDDGSHGTYDVDYPDGINPVGGAVLNMRYTGFNPSTFGGAGIQYAGIFGQGSTPGKLVYLAVPFETIYPASARDSLMARILQFFDIPTGISPADDDHPLVESFRLGQNYPNPFNPRTSIPFSLSRQQFVTLKVYDLLGREVKTLISETRPAGSYTITWDGTDNQGRPVASGMYVYRLQVGEHSRSRTMQLVR